MKKCLLMFISIGVLFVNLTVAQTKVGVIAGINFSNVDIKDTDDDTETSTRTGLSVGGVLSFTLSPKIDLLISPMYTQKGAELIISDDPNFFGAKVKFNVDVLEIPIFLKINLGNSSTKPYIMAGPAIGFIMSSKLKLSALGIDINADIDEVITSIDFGVGVGGGVNFAFGNNSLFIEGRYIFGLKDVVDDGTFAFEDDESELDGNVKTRSFQVLAGLTFPLGN